MPKEESDLAAIKEELRTISVALALIAIHQVDAADSDERERHEEASRKALDVLLTSIEARGPA